MSRGGKRTGSGGKCKPLALLKKDGYAYKKRKAQEAKGECVSIVPVTNIPIPACMDDLTQQIYLEHVDMLNKLKVLSDTDMMILQIYSTNCANWIHINNQIRDERAKGEAADNNHITVLIKLSQKLAQDILKIGSEYGLTPVSRTKLQILPDENIKPIDEVKEFI